MVILFLLFLIQFSVACACLGYNTEQQAQLAEQGWTKVDNTTKLEVQESFKCCGFEPKVDKIHSHPSCVTQIHVCINNFIIRLFCITILFAENMLSL